MDGKEKQKLTGKKMNYRVQVFTYAKA